MTFNEFKAWLEGFEEAMPCGAPTAEQWSAIKAKLEKVEIVRPAASLLRSPEFPPHSEPRIRYL